MRSKLTKTGTKRRDTKMTTCWGGFELCWIEAIVALLVASFVCALAEYYIKNHKEKSDEEEEGH